ncbi:MAG TPA: glycerol-3-phosphate 1-O-acyltransferase PlsY [Dehalococcoidia bacterium]|nr:glycerol-3-phosphate 1-O-acyltransferase PlsY [Dehalococcoidia bacterium]
MGDVLIWIAVIALSYAYGAVPWGLVIARATRGIDIRDYGSGNIGFTNALRVLPLPFALAVFALDLSKGVAPILLSRLVLDDAPLQASAGVAAIVGHVWPVFLRFKGGKGVATAAGGAFVLAPLPLLGLAAIALPFMFFTRYMSLTILIFAPLVSVVVLVLAILGLSQWAFFAYMAAGTLIIVFRHQENIARLRAGTESRLGQRAQRSAV